MTSSLLDLYLAEGETWDYLCQRVASILPYQSEREVIYNALMDREFIPNSPALVNCGRPGGRNMMACHLLHVPNSIHGIFSAVLDTALIIKSGGGLGLDFSDISPYGSSLRYAPGGIASGPVSFMEIFNTAASVVMEGGLRRAALMGTLPSWHPDIKRFIQAKTEDGVLRNFNISVTVESGPGSVAPTVWDMIVRHAWLNGEPGMVFLDNVNKNNPTMGIYGRKISCNACGEVPLYDEGSCVLGHAVLPKVIRRLGDYTRLREITRLGVRFLNTVIDRNHYPTPGIAQSTRRTREIGLGVCGWYTLLQREGIRFVSDEARQLAIEIVGAMSQTAHQESWRLAQRDGGYLSGKARNSTLLAIAPTGHTSRLVNVSYSIYPPLDIALGMTVEEHIEAVWAWQIGVDNSVSYTVNLPSDAPESDVDTVFRMAHERGLKSISVYRDGSRQGQPQQSCRGGTCGI